MRQQYHSRIVDGHTHIWDVHRLVRLVAGYPVLSIALSCISELDEHFWFGSEAVTCRDVALHAKMIQETDLAYPIIRSASGRVMDGMHRVCKALNEGRPTINAVRFKVDPEPDYVDADIEALPYDEENS